MNPGDGLTLTTRLSVFFLTTLALVLAGFALTLYVLASRYLHRQAEERLEATLNTLLAAVDVAPGGLEWEPTERHLNLGPAVHGDNIQWLVRDDQGRIVDRSRQPMAEDFLAEAEPGFHGKEKSTDRLAWQGEQWQFRQRRLEPAGQVSGQPATSQPASKEDLKRYPALSITVGVPLRPVQAAVRSLAGVLTGISLAIWIAALLVGRLVCRRALLPVRRMAAAARGMDAHDLEQRLPALASGDELEDLNHAFNSLLDRLQESFERQRRFSGDASHQLRTPLAAILGQIEVAMRRQRPADEYQRVLATVHQKADHLRRIVDALLFLTRADGEARLPDREAVELKEWLPTQLRTWSEHDRAKDIALECAGGDSCRALAQPVLLSELLNILLDNAYKYSSPGTPIAVRLRREEQAVLLQVEDHGCGIEANDLPHLFTPFYRAAATRRSGIVGVGLGLAIAQRLADACGGVLTVTSRLGQGSCFSLRLRHHEGVKTGMVLDAIELPGASCAT
jgi:heavy metal sensor kinase